MSSAKTQPDVFIVESLRLEDELQRRFEGYFIKDILAASGKQCEYYYLRTERELVEILKEFEKSKYRYLHLSCHGLPNQMDTTFDSITLKRAGLLLKPYLTGRRLFVSACEMCNKRLAKPLMSDGCMSILGPQNNLPFRDAAILWASLYHVLFSADADRIKGPTLRAKAQQVATMYGVPLRLFRPDDREPFGYREQRLTPQPEPLDV